MKIVKLEKLSRRFGTREVLKNINLEIEEGEIFGLLGPSGAGKTTIIKIVTGQISCSNGNAKLFGVDCKKMKADIYAKIGMVLDNSGLYERLSCYDNLLLFTQILGVSKKRILEVTEQVELTKALKTPVMKLSKGMKQRLVLARAILNKPKLLFLDEPTSGLDPATTLRIHELVYELQREGTTIFLTTHNMEEASKLCNNIALLNEGNIVEYGVPEEICIKYNTENIITILSKEGNEISLPNNEESTELISAFFAKNNVKSIHSSEPNLETVFISLTGRGLI